MGQPTNDEQLPAVDTGVVSKSASVGSVVLECNYEENCPPLYEAIEAAATDADFDRILNFLETGKWEGNLFAVPPFSLNPSPADQAQTWVTRFDAEDDNRVMWSQLPLHLAIVCGAPIAVIKKLVELYPHALRCTDDQHMLPLHLALRQNTSDAAVAILVTEFPEAVNTKGKNGRTAVESALRAKDSSRGVVLDAFVQRTKSRLSSMVIHEREHLKGIIESKDKEVDTVKSQLEAQCAVVEKLRSDLSKATVRADAIVAEKATLETELLEKIKDLEIRNTELLEECKTAAEKQRGSKLVGTFELQKRVEELESIKKDMEAIQVKAHEDEANLLAEVERLHDLVSSSTSAEDWNALKSEIESLRAQRLKKGLIITKSDIATFKDELDKTLVRALSKDEKPSKNEVSLQSELKSLKKSVDSLQTDEASVNSSSALSALRGEVQTLKKRFQTRSEQSKIKADLAKAQTFLEDELRDQEGKTKEELDALKNAMKQVNESDFANKSGVELTAVKSDLLTLQKQMTEKKLESSTRKEMDVLIESVASAMSTASEPKHKADLSAFCTRVNAVHVQFSDSMSNEQLVELKSKIGLLRDELGAMEVSSKIIQEAANLKQFVDEQLRESQGKTQKELIEMKNAIKAMLEIRNAKPDASELNKIKNELGSVKQGLKSIEQATKTKLELAVLKKAIEVQLMNANGKTEKELLEMRKAVDAIKMENKESQKIKKTLAAEITGAHGKTEAELLGIKKTLNKMNLSQIKSASLEEWNSVRQDLAVLRATLQEKQVVEMSATELELRTMKKVVEAVNVKAIESKNKTQFTAIRKEMDELKTELQDKVSTELALKQAIADLKIRARNVEAEPKKDKSGLKKFLARRFNRKHSSDGKQDLNNCDSSVVTCERQNSILGMNDFAAILPPSLSVHKIGSFETSRSQTNSSRDDQTPKVCNTILNEESKNNVALGRSRTEPYNMNRTLSKTLISENGEVELEVIGSTVV